MHINQSKIKDYKRGNSFEMLLFKLKLCFNILTSKKVMLVTNFIDEEGEIEPKYDLNTVNLKNDEVALISSICYSNAIYNFQVDQAITELIAD
ncbi:hypothetical protein [Flavobacterium capsici]|uniref:Uncharacterized protein n=1 Tax=Flavobacterium capsici TaxID=3075618 RepID=A0AA96J4L0_9FLAO|nr:MULTISPECIES: hypothetical protein [unclassified Flavobacterium]WNM19249.1 hypothetical protein RN608_00870 [Flavobacterium sp. PMR2A8]WNM20638.1 hypothetical protein RN605_08040 [Flavobacterium sp. PMTSA4]